MKKKVLIILPGFAIGGAENMVYELSNHINPENFDVSVLCYCGKQNTSLEKKAEDRIDVHYVNCAGTVTPQKIHAVLREIDKIRPDVVHAHMGGALYAALWTLKKRKPLVVTIHTTPQKAFSKPVERVLRFRMKFGRCRLVAVSEENKRLADQYFKLKVPCEFVNNGVDLKRFYHKEHELFTFINVARQDDNKNQKMLIEAFKKVHKICSNTKLILVGDGPNHEMLQALCGELGVQDDVLFTGNIANAEDYYAISDVYVQTSHREALPMSILEAMAAGLPIISTNVGGIKDVVKQNGYLIKDNNSDALIERMSELYNMTEDNQSRLSNQSRGLVDEFSATKMARKYENIFSNLVSREL